MKEERLADALRACYEEIADPLLDYYNDLAQHDAEVTELALALHAAIPAEAPGLVRAAALVDLLAAQIGVGGVVDDERHDALVMMQAALTIRVTQHRRRARENRQ